MSNYKLILNENELDRFIAILPETNEDEKYYISLFARRKYDKTKVVSTNKAQIKRVLAKKELIKDKIRQMEVAFGAYTDNGNSIPEEALALYISINPCSLHKGGLLLLRAMAERLYAGEMLNTHTLALNCIKSSSSKKKYFDFDFDFKEEFDDEQEVIKRIQRVLSSSQFEIVKTRGGLHLLVKLDSNLQKTWHPEITKLKCDEFDIMSNSKGLTPIPGCRQGDFSPILI